MTVVNKKRVPNFKTWVSF